MEADDAALAGAVFRRLKEWPGYEPILALLARFPSSKMFLAGGAVRNATLGRPIRDFDFFFAGIPEGAISSHLGELGRVDRGALGSPRWSPLASKGVSCDLVPIGRVDHGLGRCVGILDVLSQFDFTANAIAVDLRARGLVDPAGGRFDLRARKMRATRFDFPDTPVLPGSGVTWKATRWFRMLHYAAVLDLEIEATTREWLKANRYCRESRVAFSRLFFEPRLDLLDRVLAGDALNA